MTEQKTIITVPDCNFVEFAKQRRTAAALENFMQTVFSTVIYRHNAPSFPTAFISQTLGKFPGMGRDLFPPCITNHRGT